MSAAALPPLRWIEHRVIPGERLKEIAELYGVTARDLVEWNELNADRPMIRTGQRLRVHTRESAVARERKIHRVRRGDSWHRIARRYGVEEWRLRKRWNPDAGDLRPGDKVIVWSEADEPEEAPQPEPASGERAVADASAQGAEALPTTPTRGDSESIGTPGRGRLKNGVALPENPALYTLRKPENSYGSSHTLEHLQRAIAEFRRATGFSRELVIADISRRNGGRFRPHSSHRSGRDVDIRLPLREGVAPGTIPEAAATVDWDATWALIKALISTDQITYIFLSRPRQRPLLEAARRAGESDAELEHLIQFPGYARTALIRHSRGHTKHFHVRFKCGPQESRCRD